MVALPAGRYRIDYPARAPFVPAHIKPLRVNGRPRSDFEIEPRLAAMGAAAAKGLGGLDFT